MTEDPDPTPRSSLSGLERANGKPCFLSPNGDAEHRVMSPAEPIELLKLEISPERKPAPPTDRS